MKNSSPSKLYRILFFGTLFSFLGLAALFLINWILQQPTPTQQQQLLGSEPSEQSQNSGQSNKSFGSESEITSFSKPHVSENAQAQPSSPLQQTKRNDIIEIHQTNFKYPYVRTEKDERGVILNTMVADHLIVKIDNITSDAEFVEAIQGSQLIIRKTIIPSKLYIISLSKQSKPKTDTLEAIEKYLESMDHLVATIERDHIVYRQGIPNDPEFSNLWGLNNSTPPIAGTAGDINAPEAWEISTDASPVVVAVIDTGIDYNHEDLATNIWLNIDEIPDNGIDDDNNGYIDDIHGYDFYNDDASPMDDHYHGTHCAGTIGAVGNNANGITGVAWDAQLMAVKFLNQDGRGAISDAISAIQYAYSNGANITSNSWGSSAASTLLSTTIENSEKLFIAAAGNSARNIDTLPTYPAAFPLDNIISVAATDRNDQLANFSNYGVENVDIGAPGASIYSTLPGNRYGSLSGTSMATPHVSGACALLLALDPTLTPNQIKQHLINSSDMVTNLAGKAQSEGRLNLERLLLGASENLPSITSVLDVDTPLAAQFSYQITTVSPATWFNASPLPPGLSIDTSSGLISGIPQIGGNYSIALTAGNAKGPESATLNLNVIAQPPIITSPLTASAQQAREFFYAINATSNPTLYGATNLPSGLMLDTQFGIISGIPQEQGTFEITISATNSGGTESATLNLFIAPPALPVVISPLSVSATIFEPFLYQITATEHPNQYNASPIPAGLDFDASTGKITGSPQQLGIFNIEITASNISGHDTKTLQITVNAPDAPQLIGPLETQGQVEQLFNYNIQASNSPQSFGATDLPPGLQIHQQTGLISGSPTTPGTFLTTVTAANISGTARDVLKITIHPKTPHITSALQIDTVVNQPIEYTITSEPIADSYSATDLPSGVTLNPITGKINGQIEQVGVYTSIIAAINTGGNGSVNLILNVLPEPPQFIGPTNYHFAVNELFQIDLETSPMATSFSADNLPVGLTLNTATGEIAGSIDTEGSYDIEVTAYNAGGSTQTTLTLNVARKTVINAIAPTVINPLETLTITGSGFTNATEVYFSDRFNELIPANTFTIVSDTQIEVTVPYLVMVHEMDYSRILVNSSHGLAIAFPPDSIEVSDGYDTEGSGGKHIIVREGGALIGGGGGHHVVIENGGSAKLQDGGSHLLFVDSGGFLDLTHTGGGLHIFHTEQALIFDETEIISNLNSTFEIVEDIHVTKLDTLLYVRQLPKISSPLQVEATVGQAFTYRITSEDRPYSNLTYTSGALPNWLSFDSINGILSGYPTSSANHLIELSATNNEGTTEFVVSIDVTGDPIPVMIGDTRIVLDSSNSFDYTITTINNADTFTASGLPPGLTLNSTAGTITGTPTSSGIYTATLSAFNSFGSSSREFTFLVDESPLAISTFAPLSIASGTQLTVQGRGLELVTSGIFITRSNNAVEVANLTIQSDETLLITAPSLNHVWYDRSPVILTSADRSTVTYPQSAAVLSSNGSISSEYTIVKSGANAITGGSGGRNIFVEAGGFISTSGGGGSHLIFLEDGATADMSGGGGGHLVFKSPNSTVLNQGHASIHEISSISLSLVPHDMLNVFDLPTITSEELVIANVGDTINYQITTSEFLFYATYGAVGLPDGLSINTNSGIITGTPTESGTFTVELQVTDTNGTGTKIVTFEVSDTPLPKLTSGYRLDFQVGETINHQLQATNSPTSFNATNIPTGLTITQSGLISGTLDGPAIWSIPIEINNQYGSTGVILTIAVGYPVPTINTIPATTTIGAPLTLIGNDLDQATTVYFSDRHGWNTAGQIDHQVKQSLTVITPNLNLIHEPGSLVSIFGPGGASVVIPSTMTTVNDSQYAKGGQIYFVSSSGSLIGAGSGGITAYAQSGSFVTIRGGGGQTIFAEDNSTVDLRESGGSCTIIYAPNAKILHGNNVHLIPVHDLQYSSAPNFLQITPTPSLNSPAKAKGFLNIPFYYTITASNNPTSFNTTSLPNGLSFNSDNGTITGSPAETGKFPIELSITNSYGTTITILEIEIGDPYDYWKETTFASLDGGSQDSLALDNANPDGDSFNNLLEFALGTNPLVYDSDFLPIEIVSLSDGTTKFIAKKRKGTTSTDGINNFESDGIRYTIQHSTDLKTWNSGPGILKVQGLPIDQGDGTETITFGSTIDPAITEAEFLRILVERIN